MPGNDSNTKLLIHANHGHTVKSAFAQYKMNVSAPSTTVKDSGTGANDGTSSINTVSMGSGGLAEDGVFDRAITFNGTDSRITTPTSADWNVVADASDWTIDLWVKHTDHAGTEVYVCQFRTAGPNDGWEFYHVDGSGLIFTAWSEGTAIVNTGGSGSAGEITDTDWHHIAMIKSGSEYGLYLDGVQVNYLSDASTDTYTEQLTIGTLISGFGEFDGQMDDIRIQKDNSVFSASPNAALTDTITVPSSPATDSANTHLLMNCNNSTADTSTGGVGSPHTMTPNGNTVGRGAYDFQGVSPYSIDAGTLQTDITSDTTGSFSFWMRPDTEAAFSYTFTLARDTAGASTYFGIEYLGGASDRISAFLTISGTDSFYVNSGIGSVPDDGTWTHVVITQDGVAPKIYIDGVENFTNSTTTNLTHWFADLTSADTARIGSRKKDGAAEDRFFDGSLDDFRYYKNTVLSQAEVTALYNGGTGTEYSLITDVGGGVVSPRGHQIQTFGDAQIDESAGGLQTVPDAESFGGYASGNASGYLTVPAHSDWNFGTSDFTIDFWLRDHETSPTNTEGYMAAEITAGTDFWYFRRYGIWNEQGNVVIANYSFSSVDFPHLPNVWRHVALVRNGTSLQLFVDGTEITLTENVAIGSNSWGDWSSVYNIVYNGSDEADPIDVDIDEFRFSTTARWTTGFTPPTAPVSSDASTRLLLQNDTDVTTDTGNTGHTPAITSTLPWKPGGKWNSASLKFDGTGDYLSIPDSADWDVVGSLTDNQTIDFQTILDSGGPAVQQFLSQTEADDNRWQIFHNSNNGLVFFARLLSDTVTLDARSPLGIMTYGQWNHVAMAKVGQDIGMYLNGNQVAFGWLQIADTFAAELLSGVVDLSGGKTQYLNGNLDEVRVQADNYFSAAPNSFPAAPLLMYGDALTKSYGVFNGTNAYLTAPNSTDWDFGTGDLTIEAWVWFNDGTIYQAIASQEDSFNDLWYLGINAGGPVASVDLAEMYFVCFDSTVLIFSTKFGLGAFQENTWHHVAVCRTSGVIQGFVDGVEQTVTVNSGNQAGDMGTHSAILDIGEQGGVYLDGYLDEVRISKGVGRYTTGFTPSDDIFPSGDNDTKLLIHFDAGSSINDVGASAHTITNNNVTRELANEGYGDEGVHSDNGIDGAVNGGIERHHFKFEETTGTTVSSIAGALLTGTASTDTSNLTTAGQIDNGFDFDGSSEYIDIDSIASDVNGDTTGTISFWINTDGGGGNICAFSRSTASPHALMSFSHNQTNDRFQGYYQNDAGTIQWSWYTPNSSITDSTWHHIVVTHDGTLQRCWLDGVEQTLTYLDQTDLTQWFSGGTFDRGRIACQHFNTANEGFYDGQIDDFRYYRNMALSQFQINKIYNDGSGTHNKLHAIFFNGSTDYVTVTDTSGTDYDLAASTTDSWTLDLWAKFDVHAGTERLVGQFQDANNRWGLIHSDGTGLNFFVFVGASFVVDIATAGEIADTGWHHISIIKSADNWGTYLDGVQVSYDKQTTTGTVTGSLYIGQTGEGSGYFDGYMEQVQITKGNKFGIVPAVLRADMESTTANTGQTLTLGGTAAISTADKQFGTSSLLLDGNSDYATVPDSADFDFSTNDFTIEMWVNWNDIASTTRQPFYMHDNIADGNDWVGWRYIDSTSQFQFFVYVGTVLQVNMTPTTWLPVNGTWYHIAVVRSSGTFTLYADGVVIDTYSGYSGAMPNPTGTVMIGASDTEADYLGGYIDEVKVYNGWAKYTGAFTPPPDPGEDFSG